MEVFWISGSAPAWRVLLCLETKELEYQPRVLQTSKKEQKESWFLEINPRGQIPVLRDGDTVITESMAIMRYLEKKQPQPALFGTTLAETARIEQSVQEILSYTDPAVSRFVQPAFRNRLAEHRSAFPEISTAIHGELSVLENSFEENNWIAGAFSVADIVLVPTFQRLVRAIGREPDGAAELALDDLERKYPRLSRWDQGVRALPAFDATFPPHWRDG
jgi:glutathione S-transferase